MNPFLLHDKVAEPMITITLWKDQGKQKIKDNFTIVHRVSRDISYEPVPEFSQSPAEFLAFSNLYIILVL